MLSLILKFISWQAYLPNTTLSHCLTVVLFVGVVYLLASHCLLSQTSAFDPSLVSGDRLCCCCMMCSAVTSTDEI